MRATLLVAALTLALAGCHSDGGANGEAGTPGATVHLGDGLTIVNYAGVPVCVTGFLLEGAGPPTPLYHGILAGTWSATRPAPPLDGKLLRLRFATSGPVFDDYCARNGGGPEGFVEEASAAASPALPEIARTPDVAEYLFGAGKRRPGLGPLVVHVVRRGDGLDVATDPAARVRLDPTGFEVEDRGDSVAMYRIGTKTPLLVQRSEDGARPCLHPLMAPDLDGVLTEFSPDHHHHQTGVFVGLAQVNGKSWFHRTREGAFHRIDNWRDGAWSPSARGGSKLRWTVSDDWIGDHGPVLTETQRWELTDEGDSYLLDVRWSARAQEKLLIEQSDYGGLFIRMPWSPETGGHTLNSEGLRDAACEGQRARWVDVSVPIPGRKDGKWGHIALLDHPFNPGAPSYFRVDDQCGFGMAAARGGPITVDIGKTMIARMRLVVYLGDFKRDYVEATWKEYAATR